MKAKSFEYNMIKKEVLRIKYVRSSMEVEPLLLMVKQDINNKKPETNKIYCLNAIKMATRFFSIRACF